jgi:hypothetical protein
MREMSKPTLIEHELNLLKEELGSYRDALVAAFGIYTADPRATLLSLAREWEADREALLALTGQRCVVCQAPATREIRGNDTFFCDDHEHVDLPADIKEALCECGVAEEPSLEDIPFANSVRRALTLCSAPITMRN